MLGHDLFGMERSLPRTWHMVVLDILTSDSPVGSPGERYRFFLSAEGYKNAKASAERGEIKIISYAAAGLGRLYYDKKAAEQRKHYDAAMAGAA